MTDRWFSRCDFFISRSVTFWRKNAAEYVRQLASKFFSVSLSLQLGNTAVVRTWWIVAKNSEFGMTWSWRQFLCCACRQRQRSLGATAARTSYRNSVCPSVSLSRPGTDWSPGEIEFLPYDSAESVVSCEQNSFRRFASNEGNIQGYPLKIGYFTTISSSSVRTVADRHRLATYHKSTADELSGSTNIDDLERP